MTEPQIPKQIAWVRFPSPAPVFMRVCGHFLDIESTPTWNPSETVAEPLLNQKQKQKQEQKQEQAPSDASPSATPASDASRGSRLPSDWVLPEDWQAWAESERPDLDAEAVACRFRDFWAAKPGKDGRKADWLATWRNWVRNERAQAAPARQPAAGMFAGAI